MNQSISNEILLQRDFPNWKKFPSQFTSDDVIDAYKKGKQAGLSLRHKYHEHFFLQNLVKALESSEGLLNDLTKVKTLKIKHLFIKPVGIEDFEALFIVDQKGYLSNNRKSAYQLAKEKRKEVNNDLFYIDFIFMPDEGAINFAAIKGDGFIFQYDRKTKSPNARKT